MTLAALALTLAVGATAVWAEVAANRAGATGSGTATVSGTGTPRRVTAADNGSTLHLAVGDTLRLDLGDLPWVVRVAPAGIIESIDTAAAPGRGTYRAVAPGTTQLTPGTDYPCRHATPACMVPDQRFRLTITGGPPAPAAVSPPGTVAGDGCPRTPHDPLIRPHGGS